MRFRSVMCTLFAITLAVLAVGCRDEKRDAVHAFLLAIVQENREALFNSVTKESQTMLEYSQQGTGTRTFKFLLGDGPIEEGALYELVLKNVDGKHAQVNLKAGRKPTKGFNDPTLPAEFRKNGVPVILRNEAGKWKVDLLATIELLIEYTPEDLEFTPEWWPGLPYVPDLTSFPPPPHPKPCGQK